MSGGNFSWELPATPKTAETPDFHTLLDRLREAHEEICAQKTKLESKVNATYKQTAFVAKQPWDHVEGSNNENPIPGESQVVLNAHTGLQICARITTPRTPRTEAGTARTLHLHSSPEREPDDTKLSDSIAQLAKQQETLNEKLSEMLAKSAPNFAGQSSMLHLVGSLSDATRMTKSETATSGNVSAKCQVRKSRFRVPSGGTSILDAGEIAAPAGSHSLMGVRCPNLRVFLESTVFSVTSSLLVVSYAGIIAIETQMLSQDPDMDSVSWKTLHYIYNSLFALELLLRVIDQGRRAFSGSRDAFWNKLDALLVASALIEILLEVMALATGILGKASNVMRTIRIARLMRTLRILRTFRQFHEFQKMAFALISSFRTLTCSLMLLFFVMFLFAVGITQSAADNGKRDQIEDLNLRFGSLPSTAYTLFLSVSNGISWDDAYMPLFECSPWAAQAFMVYVAICLFGVLNVVTSIFVESVIRSVKNYQDLIAKDKELEKQIAIAHVKDLFAQLDIDGSGELTHEELENYLSNPSIRKYIEALDIDTSDTKLLFRLLDRDGRNVIDLEEFCEGCLRLKGTAKSIDVQSLMFQVKSFLEKWTEFTDYVEDSFTTLRRRAAQGTPGYDHVSTHTSYKTTNTLKSGKSDQMIPARTFSYNGGSMEKNFSQISSSRATRPDQYSITAASSRSALQFEDAVKE